MTDFEVFQKLNNERFGELLNICFGFLGGTQQPSQCLDLFKKFSEDSNIEMSVIEPLIKSILKITKDGIKFCKTELQLQEELKNLGFTDDQAKLYGIRWGKNFVNLAQGIIESTIDVNPLLDMEWKFGVTSASSEMNTVGNVFLHLKLEVDAGNSKKQVFFELQLPEFYAFLHEMERMRASLDYLS